MVQQRTIAEPIHLSGIGLHSGESIGLALSPAVPDTGVVFVRREGGRRVEIPARSDYVTSTTNATSLAREGVQVSTVEHLLAAASAMGIDNLRVEVDGPELPALDGSAHAFAERIESAGWRRQSAPRRELVILREVHCSDGARSIRIGPAARGLVVHYAVDFPHPAIGRQELALPALTPALFASELARARTFGFLDQVDALRAAGLARGASLENTLVLDDGGVMNPGGLRFPDEFVRHKVVDLIGDLALLGAPVRGRVHVERGGHGLHRALVEALRAAPDAWELVSERAPRSSAGEDPAELPSPLQGRAAAPISTSPGGPAPGPGGRLRRGR